MNNQQNRILREGLRPLDLEDLVENLFEIDTYKSKMGEDRDVCVLSFRVKDRRPAKDMMEFIEKGYHFVLDADVSAGENSKGEYTLFVELPRKSKLKEYIIDIVKGVEKITGINEWYFRYHKSFNRQEVNEKTLEETVPNSAIEYDNLLERQKTESIKSFFNKTLMDDLTRDGNIITIHKPFNQQIKLKLVDQDAVVETTERLSVDTESMSEIFWLTKVLGNYNIEKSGENFIFSNEDQNMILQRI